MYVIDDPSASVCVIRSTVCVIDVYGSLLGSTFRDILVKMGGYSL